MPTMGPKPVTVQVWWAGLFSFSPFLVSGARVYTENTNMHTCTCAYECAHTLAHTHAHTQDFLFLLLPVPLALSWQ